MTPLRLALACALAAAPTAFAAQALSTQDRYTVAVPGGLAFSEFRGYEDWSVISISENGGKFAVILGNPAMIAAYRAGAPGNGKPFPDGAMMAKIHWIPKRQTAFPGEPTIPGEQHDADFMVKDAQRFADSGGWGWAAFERDPASGAFRPADLTDSPPQAHDAKCGFACHSIVEGRDYVFTDYGAR